jgi:hypothetical protein
MVVFVDLDDESEPPELRSQPPKSSGTYRQTGIAVRTRAENGVSDGLAERVNPNKNAVTEALGCYP